MRFENINRLDWVLDVSPQVNCFHRKHSVYSHGREKVVIATNQEYHEIWEIIIMHSCLLSDDFTRHARLGSVHQRLTAQHVHLDAQLVLHEFHSFPTRETVTGNDSRGVDLRFYELVCPPEQLRSDDHHGSRTVAHFLVLFLCKVDKYASSRMLYSQERQDGGTVIGDRNFLSQIEDERLHTICRKEYAYSDVVH